MGNRLSKIITKTGDDGTTGISGNTRLPKYHIRIDAIGTIDELNSYIGIGLALLDEENLTALSKEWLKIQHHLFSIGGELSMPEYNVINEENILELEKHINLYNESLPLLKEFILPSGSLLLSQTHLIRSYTRKAERKLWQLHENEPLNIITLRYLNRLSDYFFIIARIIAKKRNIREVYWQKELIGE